MIALLVGDDGRLLAHAARVLELRGWHVLAADHAHDALELAAALPAVSLLLWTGELRDGPAAETAALIADRWPGAVTLAVVPDTASARDLAALARVTDLRLCTRASLDAALRQVPLSRDDARLETTTG